METIFGSIAESEQPAASTITGNSDNHASSISEEREDARTTNHAGESQSTSSDESKDANPAIFSQRMFSSEQERKDTAVRLALSGQTLEEALKSLELFFSAKQKRLEASYNFALGDLDSEIETLNEDLRSKQALLNDASNAAELRKTELQRIDAEMPTLEQRRNDAWHEILHYRFKGGQEFFESQHEHLENDLRDNKKHVVADIDAQIEIDQKLYDVQKKNHDINSAEFKRRIDVCSEEKKNVEEKLKQATDYTDNLKKIGVTRTSATFLFVAGFVSLAGVGSVISNLLYDRQPGEDLLSRLVQNIGGIANGFLPLQLAPWAPAVRPFIFVSLLIMFLAGFYGLIRLMDWLVYKFDNETWGLKEEEQEASKSPRTLHEQFTGFASSALSISSQFSNFLPFNVERKDYTKLLAAFPFLFLGGVIVFLFSTGGQMLSLTTAYIGVIFALLATSVSVLYVTKIIEPRWDNASRANDEKNENRRAVAYARINRELTGLFALMIVSLLIAAIMPAQSQYWRYLTAQQTKLIVWGFIALFMCLSSLALAYGIIQRGIFKDVDHLTRRRNEYRALIEKFSMQPIVGGSGYGRSYGTDIRSSHYFDLIHRLEDHKLWYELNEIFGDDFEFENPPTDNVLSSLWFNLRRSKGGARPGFLALRLRKELPREPRVIDFAVAPEQTKAFLSARERLNNCKEQRVALTATIESASQRFGLLSQETKTLEANVAARGERKRQLQAQLANDLNDLLMEKEKELMNFRGCFALGFVARSLLRNEGILPQSHLSPELAVAT